MLTCRFKNITHGGIVKRGARPLQGGRSLSFLGGRDE